MFIVIGVLDTMILQNVMIQIRKNVEEEEKKKKQIFLLVHVCTISAYFRDSIKRVEGHKKRCICV